MWCIAVLLAFVLCIAVRPSYALDNGLGRTPPMGFNPWNCFGTSASGKPKLPGSHGFNQTVMMQVADAFVQHGLRDAGYVYINLDCGYSTGHRDAQGLIETNSTKYPDGLKFLADYIHKRQMKFGIYSDAGPVQCCSREIPHANDGSDGRETVDAKYFASLGVDYLKHDDCNNNKASYPKMRDALNATGRPIFYSVHGPYGNGTDKIANIWRTTADISNSWDSILSRIAQNDQYADAAGPGGFNDPDMLEVGNPPLTDNENRAHFSLWCIAKAPLLIGTDPTNMTSATVSILTNKRAIAINQDSLGEQGRLRYNTSSEQVWTGRLSGGKYAAVLVNTGDSPKTIKLEWSMLPGVSPTDKFDVYDIWADKSLGIHDTSISITVNVHDAAFFELTPSSQR